MIKNIIQMFKESFAWPYLLVWAGFVAFVLLAIYNWDYISK